MKKWMHFQVSCFPQSDSFKKKFLYRKYKKNKLWSDKLSWEGELNCIYREKTKINEPKQSDREDLNHLQWFCESKTGESTYSSMFLVPL